MERYLFASAVPFRKVQTYEAEELKDREKLEFTSCSRDDHLVKRM